MPPRGYVRADFVYLEDMERRWVAVGIYSAILLLVAGAAELIPAANIAGGNFSDVSAMFLGWGILMIVPVMGPLSVFVSGEAAIAGFLAGISLVIVSILMFQGYITTLGPTAAALLVVGLTGLALGAFMAARCRVRYNAADAGYLSA